MFEFSHLRCFIAVADELHFGRAAARLNMTQPPLSRQIQLLERSLGVQLLERSSRTVRLTHAGRAFLPEARRILRLSENARRWTQGVWRGEAGTLRIGFTAASAYRYLPSLLLRIRERLPAVDVQLREMVTSAQVEALMSDALDVGFLRPPVDQTHLVTHRIGADAFLAALPKTSALAPKSVVELADFEGEPMVTYAREGSGYFHNLTGALFNAAGVTPRHVQEVTQIHTMLVLVNAGLGSALVPSAAACLQLPNVLFKPVPAAAAQPIELYLAWRRDNDNPALRPFLAECAGPDLAPDRD